MLKTDYFHHIAQLMWYRELQNISTQELAELSGVSKDVIEAFEEHDYWRANFDIVSKITKALGLTIVFVDSDK